MRSDDCLTRLSRPEVASAAGKHRSPDGRIGGLLARPEKENAVRRQQAVNISQQRAPRLLREVEHHVAHCQNLEMKVPIKL